MGRRRRSGRKKNGRREGGKERKRGVDVEGWMKERCRGEGKRVLYMTGITEGKDGRETKEGQGKDGRKPIEGNLEARKHIWRWKNDIRMKNEREGEKGDIVMEMIKLDK